MKKTNAQMLLQLPHALADSLGCRALYLRGAVEAAQLGGPEKGGDGAKFVHDSVCCTGAGQPRLS